MQTLNIHELQISRSLILSEQSYTIKRISVEMTDNSSVCQVETKIHHTVFKNDIILYSFQPQDGHKVHHVGKFRIMN